MRIYLITLLFIGLLTQNVVGQQREFIAMEYVGGIGNRILKVWVTSDKIFAAKVKGLTSESLFQPANYDSDLVISTERRNNPDSYVNKKRDSSYSNINFDDITPEQFLNIDNSNFVILKNDIEEFYHNPKKKWGMGNYPHNGRIFIISLSTKFNKKHKREFILVGNQDEEPILKWLSNE